MSGLLLSFSSLLCMFFPYVARLIIWWVRLALTYRNKQVICSFWALVSRGWICTHQGHLNLSTDCKELGASLSWPSLQSSSRRSLMLQHHWRRHRGLCQHVLFSSWSHEGAGVARWREVDGKGRLKSKTHHSGQRDPCKAGNKKPERYSAIICKLTSLFKKEPLVVVSLR